MYGENGLSPNKYIYQHLIMNDYLVHTMTPPHQMQLKHQKCPHARQHHQY